MTTPIGIEHELIRLCSSCNLREKGITPVPGEGYPICKVVILGRNPGWVENTDGRPFVGPGGKRLSATLRQIGFWRDQFYITNLVKCHTINDWPPNRQQMEKCTWWKNEMAIVMPHFVIALGNQVFSYLAGQDLSTVRSRRQILKHALGFKFTGIVHPGAALRSNKMQRFMEEDLEWFLDSIGYPTVIEG